MPSYSYCHEVKFKIPAIPLWSGGEIADPHLGPAAAVHAAKRDNSNTAAVRKTSVIGKGDAPGAGRDRKGPAKAKRRQI